MYSEKALFKKKYLFQIIRNNYLFTVVVVDGWVVVILEGTKKDDK